MRTGRGGVCMQGLADADGLQLAQDIGDVLVVLGEDLRDEGDDGAGDALLASGPRHAGTQGGDGDVSEGLRGEGVRARLAPLGPDSAVRVTMICSATSTSSAGIRGSVLVNSVAASASSASMARR
ncbi:hypothetical protein ACZ91_11800 [Streptomyces regensis]|nr:hypothetical protein ACZ91_11800 [Streptomyces regensis]KOG70222.1 hypothetical protein ADK77_12325 [Streptomyces antibioticus]